MPAGGGEVTLYVSDLKASARFYGEVLDFTFDAYVTTDGVVVTDERAEGDIVCATLRAGSLTLNLVSAPTVGAEPGTAVEHAVAVPNVDAAHARACAARIRVSDPTEKAWGRCEFDVADPDGYTWIVYQAEDVGIDRTEPQRRGEITGYYSAEELLRAAGECGLTLQQYLDTVWHTGEATIAAFAKGVFARAADFGVFDRPVRRVVEIGTGVGMYVPAILDRCRPESYESYEPREDWARWLAEEYGVISHDCDGVSLRQTPSASAHLVHAHGVFVVLPFLTSVQYFREIGRVLQPGGHAVFDVLSEVCLGATEAINAWLASEWRWPVLLTTDYVSRFMEDLGLVFAGDFVAPAFEGGRLNTHYLVFRKL